MKKILIAYDFSDLSGPVLRTASDLAKALNASVILLHTEPPRTGYIYYSPGYTYHGILGFGLEETVMQEIESEQLKHDRQALDVLESQLQQDGIAAESLLLTGDPSSAILDTASDRDVDLVVVGAHSHGAFYKFLFGCVDADLVQKAPCPVLIVPETAVKKQ